MSKSSPLLDDLLPLGGSLLQNIDLTEMRSFMRDRAKMRLDGLAQKFDLVGREEFDAAFAMLSKARAIQEELADRLSRIEAHLGLSSTVQKKKAAKVNLPSVKQGKKRGRRA